MSPKRIRTRNRVKNATTVKDPRIIEAFIQERLKLQEAFLKRPEKQVVEYNSPYYGCSFVKEFAHQADAEAYVEWVEENTRKAHPDTDLISRF